jgi:hypothetical protein
MEAETCCIIYIKTLQNVVVTALIHQFFTCISQQDLAGEGKTPYIAY